MAVCQRIQCSGMAVQCQLMQRIQRIQSHFSPRIQPVCGPVRQFSHHLSASPAAARPKTAPEENGEALTIDLHKWAPEWTSHPSKWVVFSDLHVTPRTLPVCLDVLRRVRDEAAVRDAGIAFLGDFWHLRGSLPIEPLNTLISLFANEWNVQTLMLAGNHDQVMLGGLTHGLTPLAAAASDTIHVCDGPAIYAGALWLPYRRNSAELEQAINGAMDDRSSSPKAIFAHVDVQGASLNNVAQARDGFPPSLFPQGVPVYTGHYHKPHIVPGTQIRYVGSPYQISRSEAGQTKALLVLDENWHVCEEIVLDLGPRHFDVAASLEGHELMDVLPTGLRRGDKLRVTLTPEHVKQQNKLLKKLSSKGIGVEVVTVAVPSAAPRIAAAEDLGSLELFEKYAEIKGMNSGAINRGLEILRAVTSSAVATHCQVSLSFSSVEVEGYFSFVEPQTYELKDRGLVVVTGQLENAAGAASQPLDSSAESNGAGKTALVMAPLWALTGDVDARSELGAGRGLTNADVVNEDSKFARVKLQGTVDDVPFVVERKVVRRGRGGYLTFELDGTDRTTQDIRLTQAEIDAVLGTTLLGRSAFYGQSEITALLESSDKAFKEELAKIVDLAVWAEAKEESRKALAKVKGKVAALGTEIQVKQGYVEQQEAEASALDAQRAVYMEDMQVRKESSKQRVEAAMTELQRSKEELRRVVEEAEKVISVGGESSDDGSEEVELRDELPLLERQLAEAQESLAAAQLRRGAAHATATTKQTQLQNYSNLYDHDGGADDIVCDRCLQPVSSDQRASTTATLEAELESALHDVDSADRDAASSANRVSELAAAVQAERQRQMELMQAQAAAKAEAAQIRSDIQRGVDESRHLLRQADEISNGRGSVVEIEIRDERLLAEALRHSYQSCSITISAASAALSDLAACDTELNPLDAEISRKQVWLEKERMGLMELERHLNESNTHPDQLKAVNDAFRPTGIVSFVLEGALGALQQSTNHNLATLAPGMALELSASRPRATNSSESATAAASTTIEQVEKKVLIRLPGSNELRQRSVRQLSGGERRRVALALALGFTDLAARRGRLRCDLLVLDEVMQHLDGEGCARLAGLLRGLDEFGTVLVVAQAKSFMTRSFDGVDVVVKGEKGSMVMKEEETVAVG